MKLLSEATLPDRIDDVPCLDDLLSRPTQALIDDLREVAGDLLILGVGGKMGPTVASLAKAAAPGKRVIGIARFTTPGLQGWLEARGVETIACDLMDEERLRSLPRADNVVFMAGRKFGASGDLPTTWAMNVQMPSLVAQAFPGARIVAYSTGCVYPFAPVVGGGCSEDTPPDPVGEYAQTCLGRERMFEYFSGRYGTPGRLVRLNYAVEMRYGVLHDIATKIVSGQVIDVTMGHVNVIWQGDAAAQSLRCLRHCTAPTSALNVSGGETLRVRDIAAMLGRRLGREPVIAGCEADTAWLTDTHRAESLFGPPVVGVERVAAWTADWVLRSMPSLDKPTKFEVRDGRY